MIPTTTAESQTIPSQCQRSLKIKRALCGMTSFIFIILLILMISVVLWFAYYSKIQQNHGIMSYFPELKDDASRLTWAHRVNNKEKLKSALQSKCHFLEVDVMLLKIGNSKHLMMAHPPETSSNLSMNEMLTVYKTAVQYRMVGLKLDFKEDDAIVSGLKLVLRHELKYSPIIINADILKSDKDECITCPIRNSQTFLDAFFSYNPGNWALSVGWSTNNTVDGYTWKDVIRMHEYIQNYQISKSHLLSEDEETYVEITFPVRESKIHWESLRKLIWLVEIFEGSLTVFSSPDSSRIAETRNGLIVLMQMLVPDSIYFDLGNYNSTELDDMRQMRDYNKPAMEFEHFEYSKWQMKTGINSSAIANNGGIVLSGTDAHAIYQRALKISDNSPRLIVNLVVQFVSLLDDPPSCKLVICLLSTFQECDIEYRIDSSFGKSIGKIYKFEYIYQITIAYNVLKKSIYKIIPSIVTNSGFRKLPGQDYNVERNYQFYSNRTYHFRLSSECSSTTDRLIIENAVLH